MTGQESSIVLDEKREILGSVIRITAVIDKHSEDQAKNAIRRAFSECERLDTEYSRFRTDNQLSALNGSIGKWQDVSAELFFLLEQGEKFFQQTGGAFNLGVKSLLEKWGYDAYYTFNPSDSPEGLHQQINFQDPPYELVPPHSVKMFYPIELGGLGKGYALDLMVKALKNFPVFCVDAGGDLYARGIPEDGKAWDVFFENPIDPTSALGKVEVDNFFLASSNPLKRRWAKNYHHLADPRSKQPARQMLGVYTQASKGLLADAYSTALFILGFEEAKNLLPNLPVEAMLISPQGEICKTIKFRGELFLSNDFLNY